eukprot:9600_1
MSVSHNFLTLIILLPFLIFFIYLFFMIYAILYLLRRIYIERIKKRTPIIINANYANNGVNDANDANGIDVNTNDENVVDDNDNDEMKIETVTNVKNCNHNIKKLGDVSEYENESISSSDTIDISNDMINDNKNNQEIEMEQIHQNPITATNITFYET